MARTRKQTWLVCVYSAPDRDLLDVYGPWADRPAAADRAARLLFRLGARGLHDEYHIEVRRALAPSGMESHVYDYREVAS